MNDHEKILTISVAAYNSESFLKRCLDSLVGQRMLERLEIIVVNDGSTDGTLEIANLYQKNYPDSVFVIDKENGGHGSTINSSLARATGKYYKIVDSDDWVESKGLEMLIEELSDKEADLILNPYFLVEPDEIHKEKKVPFSNADIQYGKEYSLSKIPSEFDISMHGVTVKTSILKSIGSPLDEHCFYVDQELILYPIAFIQSFCYLPFEVYNYLFGTEEQSCNEKNMIKRRDEHKKVCCSVLDYYLGHHYNEAQNRVILTRMLGLLRKQYDLYYDAGVIAEKDFREYDQRIMKASKSVYREMVKGFSYKRRIMLVLLHCTQYRLYRRVCEWRAGYKSIWMN